MKLKLLRGAWIIASLLFATTSWGKEYSCKSGIGASEGAKPVLVYESPQGPVVLICGYKEGDEAVPPGRVHVSEFDIRVDGADSKDLLEVGALGHYYAGIEKRGLVLEELAWYAGKWEPFLRSYITCSDKKLCKQSKPECVLKIKKNPHPGIVKKVREGVRSALMPPMMDTLVGELGEQALSGDKEALREMNDPKLVKRLDGAIGEEYEQANDILRKAKKAGCL